MIDFLTEHEPDWSTKTDLKNKVIGDGRLSACTAGDGRVRCLVRNALATAPIYTESHFTMFITSGWVKKVRSKGGISLSSSVGLSIDDRFLVLTDTHLHCFYKEPIGYFVFEHKNVELPGVEGAICNNLVPYASIDMGTGLNFVRPYETSPTCRVFEIQDRTEVNKDRVFAFEVKSAEELHDEWLTLLRQAHQSVLQNEQRATKERRLAETPLYVKLFDGLINSEDDSAGKDACRGYFRRVLENHYPSTLSMSRDSESWAANIAAGDVVLEYMEQITFETTVAPVPVLSAPTQNYTVSADVKEKPLGRVDVLALAVDVCREVLTDRFRHLLFDASERAALEEVDEMRVTKRAHIVSERRLSEEIITTKGLEDLHLLVGFIMRYQRNLHTMLTTVAATTTDDSLIAAIPSHAELFEYLPCVYDRYVHGLSPPSLVPLSRSDTSGALSPGVAAKASSDENALSDGAANQILDHCIKVWEGIRVHPADAILKHVDGTYYTEGPTAAWICLHQHLSLAEQTSSSVLHVMVAEKVAQALCYMFRSMGTFCTPGSNKSSRSSISSNSSSSTEGDAEDTTVPTLDALIRADESVKETEVEFLCAIANDCGIHLDEVLAVVGNFKAIESVRQHVDASFDGVSKALMDCAMTALQRLVHLALEDVDSQFAEVFTTSWSFQTKQHSSDTSSTEVSADNLGGVQVNVILNTLNDYLDDFRVFLVQFWYDKFCSMAYTLAINAYMDMIVSRIAQASSTGFFGSIMSSGNSAAISAIPGKVLSDSQGVVPVASICKVDPTSISKLRKDMDVWQRFIAKFSKRTGSNIGLNTSRYTDLLKLFLLLLDFPEKESEMPVAESDLGTLIREFAESYPFATTQLHKFIQIALNCHTNLNQSVKEGILALAVVPETGSAIDAWNSLDSREQLQKQQQQESVPGVVMSLNSFLRYSKNISTDEKQTSSQVPSEQSWSPLSPLAALRTMLRADNANRKEGSQAKQSLRRNSSGTGDKDTASVPFQNTSDEVTRLVREHELSILAEAQAAERAEAKANAALEQGFLHCVGVLHKRSVTQGKTGIWQRRFVKLSSRKAENESGQLCVLHSIHWYKHQGGVVVGSVEAAAINALVVLAAERPLEYFPDTDSTQLAGALSQTGILVRRWRDSNGTGSDDDVSTHHSSGSKGGGDEDAFVMRVIARGQTFEARCFEVDVFLKWLNAVTVAAGLSYDENIRQYSRPARERLPITLSNWKKAAVLVKKEESALSAILQAKEQQRRERADREKSQSASPAGLVAAALKANNNSTIKETMNPMMSPTGEAEKNAATRSTDMESPSSVSRRLFDPSMSTPLTTSQSADSLVAPKLKLSLQLPSAVKQNQLSFAESVPPAPLTSPTPRASRSMENLSFSDGSPMDSFPSVVRSPMATPAPKTGRAANAVTPLNISSTKNRLRSAEMPPPRRSSLKSPSAVQMNDLSRTSSLSSITSTSDWDMRGSFSSQSEDEKSVASDVQSTNSSSTSNSTNSNSTNSSSTNSSCSSGKKSVSFKSNELREYEPRSAPEEIPQTGKEIPQSYSLSSVQNLPVKKRSSSSKSKKEKKDKKKKKKKKDKKNKDGLDVAQPSTGCCPCS